MGDTVLIVDDEQAVRELLVAWLEDAGYETCSASNGIEGLKELYQHRPDLVVADIIMPEMDGYEFCRLVREASRAPIIILSGLGRVEHKIKGLDLGADDYVAKPVGMDEFLARVAALLRRSRWSEVAPARGERYVDDSLSIDLEGREVWLDGKRVELTPIEFRLLCVLTESAGKTCRPDEIRRRVWESAQISPEALRWHIAGLRGKIEEDPKNPQRIVTAWGIGYRYQTAAASQPDSRG